jgi:hypothetical protein
LFSFHQSKTNKAKKETKMAKATVPQIDLEAGQNAPIQEREQNMFDRSSHPVALFFLLFFRTLAIASYLLASFLFPNSFAFAFVIIVLLLTFDFWTVKNISGRLLVGLRWWSQIKEDGTEEWIFESRADGRKPNPSDSRIFWWSLYLTPAFWCLLALVCIFTFQFAYLLIVAVALSLSSANLLAYSRCEKDARKRLQGYVTNGILGKMMGNSKLFSLFA